MRAPVVLFVVASVATAVNAGVFFAFSTFVMRAVDDLGPAGSVRAMQEINRRAPTPAFMALLFGSTLLAVASGAADRWRDFAAPWLRANHVRGVLGVLASLLLAVAAVAAG